MLKHLARKIFTAEKDDQTGFSTLEVLLAFAVVIICVSAVIALIFGSQVAAVDSQTNSEAAQKAQEMLENARATAKQNFSLVVPIPAVTDGIYQKTLDVQSVDAYTKKATATVSWTATGGRNLNVTLATLLTNPYTNICNPTLTGDWTRPQVYGYVDFASAAGATGVSVLASKAYVTSDPSSPGTDDFYAINVTDPTLRPLPILGHFSTSYGLTDVRAGGQYAYVTAHSAAYQFLVIDVSDPANLSPTKIVAKKDVTSAGDTAYGNTIFYANKKIYLGLTISTGKEFHIFDVSTPTNPVELGTGYEVGAAINSIVVKNNIAYLATAANNEVIALDVSDPVNPTQVGAYTSATLTGQSLTPDNATTLYFGRIGGNGNPKLLALNTANLSVPKWTMNMNSQSGVYTMILRNNLLFMTTADPNDGLQIWDISHATATIPPTRYDTSPLNIQQTATAGSACVGNFMYVAQRSQRALQIIGPYIPNLYSLTNSGDVSVVQGSSGNNTITATITSGSPPNTTFSASGLPAGASPNFSPGACTPNCSTVLTISTTFPTTPVGTYPITVTGTGGVTTTFNLNVTTQPFDFTLSNSGNITVNQGASGSNTITRTLNSGSPSPVTLTASGLPAGASASFTNNPCTPNCSSALTITTAFPTTPAGTYPITVSGSGKTTTFNLVVNPQPFDYSLSASPASPTMHQSSSITETVTVTKTAGATAQSVAVTLSGLQSNVSYTPASGSCTPTGGSCTITFTITAASNAQRVTRTITVSGSSPAHATSFSLTVIN